MDVAINDIDILRKHLNINKLSLYAHSWGSMLAAGYIATFPEHVKLFVSVGGGEIDTSLTDVIGENRNARVQFSDTSMIHYWLDSNVIKKDPAKATYELRKLRMLRSVPDTSQIEKIIKQMSNGGSRNNKMSDLMWQSIGKELHFVIADQAYSGAVLVVFGWNDMIGLTTATQYLQAFPKAEVHGVFNSGHYPEIEQPEQFYTIVNEFLEKHIPGTK